MEENCDHSRLAQALDTLQSFQREPNHEYVDRSSMRRYLRQGSSLDLQNVHVDIKDERLKLLLELD